MKRLSGLDSLFLSGETEAAPLHIGGLIVVDPRAAPHFNFDAVRGLLQRRMHLMPALRRRLVVPPLNLVKPFWIEDPDFRISQHVKRLSLHPPGTDAQLDSLIADLMRKRLNRDRPLWMFYYIEGLSGGRIACFFKVHHACIDGISGADFARKLLDTEADAIEPSPPERAWVPDAIPSLAELSWITARGILTAPRQLAKLVADTRLVIGDVLSANQSSPQERSVDAQHPSQLMGPRTRFNTMITAERVFARGTIALAQVKEIKDSFDVSVNDVILALCAEALRNYLSGHNELPEAPLYAGVPVSVRSKSEYGIGGNRVILPRVSLATNIADPVERLLLISRRMNRVKRVQKAIPAKLLMEWIDVPAPAMISQVAWLYENLNIQRLINPPFNLLISNVPGPAMPLYFAGARVEGLFPVSIPYHGMALNISLMSYDGHIHFGLTAHRGTVPDIDRLMILIKKALKELRQRARSHREHAAINASS